MFPRSVNGFKTNDNIKILLFEDTGTLKDHWFNMQSKNFTMLWFFLF